MKEMDTKIIVTKMSHLFFVYFFFFNIFFREMNMLENTNEWPFNASRRTSLML